MMMSNTRCRVDRLYIVAHQEGISVGAVSLKRGYVCPKISCAAPPCCTSCTSFDTPVIDAMRFVHIVNQPSIPRTPSPICHPSPICPSPTPPPVSAPKQPPQIAPSLPVPDPASHLHPHHRQV
jgi:hypothetical protein